MGDTLELKEIDSAFTFLGEGTGNDDGGANTMSYVQFARKYFQDKSTSSYKHKRGAITGPLLKQIWGDQDAERVLTVWFTIQRFMGDLPPKDDEETSDNLQRVQLICNTGITRANTRDEIYCQVCKQLTENPNKVSRARGYILLALIAGCFLPSDAFIDVLRRFMHEGPPAYSPFLLQQLERTQRGGTRHHPTTAVEMMMAFKRAPVEFMIHFYVGSHTVKCDSQSTNDELIAQCYEHDELSPELGLTVYITSPSTEIMTSLSTGYSHVMDAVFEYENLMSSKADWRLISQRRPWLAVLRKECFAPWFEGTANLQLVYSQIMDGMIRGFYVCDTVDDLAMLLAQRYYIKYGHVLKPQKLLKQLRSQPVAGMHVKTPEEWAQLATTAFDSKEYYGNACTSDDVKVEVVQYAREHWFIEFSRRFLHCDLVVDGKKTMDDMAVLVNCKGLYFFESKAVAQAAAGGERFCAPFDQFVDVSPLKPVHEDDQELQEFSVSYVTPDGLSTVRVETREGARLRELITQFHQGVVYRSKYCIASLDYRAPGNNSAFLSFQQGDLILLPKMWAEVDEAGWATGVCERSGAKGDFPAANVFVVPSLKRPTTALLSMFVKYIKTVEPAAAHEL
ncbi:hypothetical protein PTSG_00887 [Salpingoeca rosetta]|uniref:SH3 domain-containing protein n=1 Tax=Salpingoeca rosetta (strain ATCC 50818 / BSB-021) TaxID=946362 RepID=F2TXS2_SALR5|nr:uncharacterized protein PTSG_00887 [Salpingoeca rosetta]EGD76181.1 hypothetical protein PTSG_00887 [Salpingoeca rosetta]|eukprot:XP_004998356.1 hypothetical protein PTSG_00887 [Salpingoeca rosetta]